MDPEIRRVLEEIHSLARDNHHMLRSIRRHQIIMDFGKFFIWIILLIGAAYGYLAYLQPYIETFRASGVTSSNGLFGLPTSAELQKLIDSYKVK